MRALCEQRHTRGWYRLASAVAGLVAPAATMAAQSGPDAWRIVAPAQSSVVLARDGSVIGELGREWRTLISLRTLPKYVSQAFIAGEDQRFYQHDGVDLVGVAVPDQRRADRGAAAS